MDAIEVGNTKETKYVSLKKEVKSDKMHKYEKRINQPTFIPNLLIST